MTLEASPKTMPNDPLLLLPDADAEVAWFGSKRTPEKKPTVTMLAAVRERRVGYCWYRQYPVIAADAALEIGG